MQAYLEVKEAKGERRIPLEDGPLTIGRNFTNLLVLDETQASRFHCVIEKGPEGYAVRDLDSRNGTRVNGTAVRAAVLYDGDVVSIGKTEMRLVLSSGSKSKAAAADDDDPFQQLADLVSGVTPAAPPQEPAFADESDALEATVVEPPPQTIVSSNEYERALRERAEALADRSFAENNIMLINARGKPAYNAEREVGDAVVIIRLILLICFRSRATDIHVEPKVEEVLVRVRVDGQMVDVIHLSRELGVKLLSAIKVLSDVDIAQRNIVQEGHFASRVPGGRTGQLGAAERQVDYRVSFAPAMHGQKLVIRILDAANAPLHIDDLQLPPKALEIIRKASQQESGMILVGGPTGSGKTTTLYAILRDIDVTQCNVVTIEDPVEIQLDGVTQIPVNEAQGNSFSALLRSVLRQDPDVILVGEIRDAETARVGVQAGMTGHLVFSTVHSRDALSAMFRLLDLGVEPYVLSAGLHLVIAQRLVRQLCRYCKVPHPPTAEQTKTLNSLGFRGVQKLFVAKGCRRCLGTGHLGRRAVFEVLVATPALRETILKNPNVEDCRKALDPGGYITLADSGYRLVAEGVAAFEELEHAIA